MVAQVLRDGRDARRATRQDREADSGRVEITDFRDRPVEAPLRVGRQRRLPGRERERTVFSRVQLVEVRGAEQ